MRGKNGRDFIANNSKNSLLELAILNMSAKFYTTPDTASATPKIILENIFSGMEELMESRLKSTLIQLVSKSAERGVQGHLNLMFKLISPSRNPLRIASMITQFVVPEHTSSEDTSIATDGDVVTLELYLKAIIDVVIFGDVKTVALQSPVTISAKFDSSDLMSAIDVKFDCETLLKSMISNSRLLVTTLIKKAAALSIKIAKYHEEQSSSALFLSHLLSGKKPPPPPTWPSLHSLGSFASDSLCSNISNLFSIGSSSTPGGRNKQPANSKQNQGIRRTTLPVGGLRRTSFHNNVTLRVNEEFDLTRDKSVVRFNIPDPSESSRVKSISPTTAKARESGNIHQGLFNWIQNDKMFLTEDKLKEQNAINEELERKAQEEPMPRRLFTREEISGGEGGLNIVSHTLFGVSMSGGQSTDKRLRSDEQNGSRKRRKEESLV